MASPVDSARVATNIATAATSHAINVGSPVAGTLLVVNVRFAAAPGAVTFTGYTQFGVTETSDASDDETRFYYRQADGTEGATDTLATTNSVKLAAICWEITGAFVPIAPIVQSTFTGGVTGIGAGVSVAYPAQQFTALADGKIASVAINTTITGSPTDGVTVEIQTHGSGQPSGTILESATLTGLVTGLNTFVFTTPVQVTSGVQYWIVVKRTGADDPSNQRNWRLDNTSPYTGGVRGSFFSGSWSISSSSDYAFRVDFLEPRVSTAVIGTAANINPGGFSSLELADYLFLTVIGMDSETGTATVPAGYSNQISANSGTGGAVATNCIIWGGSKQATTVSSEDPAAWTSSAPATGVTAFTIAIPPAPPVSPPKSTPVARVSLASYGEPATRTAHSIKVRARTTSGSSGAFSVALYEGANNRSGDLITLLTNSLADYTLNIPDALAASITSYSDLEIRFYGDDPNGLGLVFEVADLYLEVPASTGPQTFYGVTSLPIIFTKSVAASRKTFSQIAAPFTFTKAVSGLKVVFGQIVAPFTFVKTVGGVRRTVSQIVAPFIFTKDVAARRQTFAQVVRPITFVKDVAARRTTFSQVVAPFTFSKAVGGIRVIFGQVTRPFTFVKDVAAKRTTFGQIAAPFTFGKVVSGVEFVYGQVTRPFTFVKDVSARRTTFGQVAAPFTFSKAVSGIRVIFGQIVSPFTFSRVVSGSRKTFGQIAAPFIFVKDVSARRTAFGQTTISIVVGITTAGVKTITTFYGVVSAPFTFTKSVSGRRGVLGQIVAPFTFSRVVNGSRRTVSQIVAPFTFVKSVAARKTTFGQIVAPFTFGKVVGGVEFVYGQITRPFTFVKDVSARRTTFGQVVRPFTFVKDVAARRTALGQIVAPFTFVKAVAARRTALGQIVAPFTFSRVVSGSRKTFGQIVAPFTFVKSVVGRKTTFGQVVRPFVFTKAVVGIRTAIAQVARSFTFNRVVTGRKTTFSRVDLPLIFVDQTNARKQTFGRIVFPIDIDLEAVAEVQGIRYGEATMSLVFGKDVKAFKKTYGQVAAPYLFERSTQSRRTTFGQVVRPFTFVKAVVGRKTTFGQSSLPINVSFVVAARRLSLGRVALSLVFGEQTVGQRKALGRTASSYSFNRELSGRRETFGLLDLPIDFVVDVNTGRVDVFSSLGAEFIFAIESAGMVRPTGIILNLAKALYLGSTPVDAVYVDSQKVWSK